MRYKIHRNLNKATDMVAKSVNFVTESVEYMNLQAGL